MMIPTKEVPLRAVPFAVFITAFGAFGELFVRIDSNTWPHAVGAWIFGGFTVASGVLFFTKVLIDWPGLPGLDLRELT